MQMLIDMFILRALVDYDHLSDQTACLQQGKRPVNRCPGYPAAVIVPQLKIQIVCLKMVIHGANCFKYPFSLGRVFQALELAIAAKQFISFACPYLHGFFHPCLIYKSTLIRWLIKPPVRIEELVITATIKSAVLHPSSLIITMILAKQGMKSEMVIVATQA